MTKEITRMLNALAVRIGSTPTALAALYFAINLLAAVARAARYASVVAAAY